MDALILDDVELNNLIVAEAVRAIPNCTPRTFTSPREALAYLTANAPVIGIAITDYDMPEMNGVQFIEAARAVDQFRHVPIVMVTSNDQRALRREALAAGATDFLAKPVDPVEIRARVSNLLALRRALRDQEDRTAWLDREVAAAVATIEAREQEIILLLMRAAEQRDTDTGDHVARVATYVGLIAEALGFPPAECRQLCLASTMHDVGKIGVPDAILLKPGPLTVDERAEMERHAERGRRILESSTSDIARLAATIAGSHHERWDGTGYPTGLSGEAIPLAGRIVAVADVFDALTTQRPYKRAWTLSEARAFLEGKVGSHFDPTCVAAFLRRWPDIVALAEAERSAA